MHPSMAKEEIANNLARLVQLRDEVRLKLHLASREARTEWDEKLAPRVFELEQAAKSLGESPRVGLQELVRKLEDFLSGLGGGPSSKDRGAPHSVH
jgi:hypothetical protein